MKIKIKDWMGVREETIQRHIEAVLDGGRDGVSENAQATAAKTSAALGRLVNLLAEKRILDASEVLHVSGGYSSETPELKKE